MPEPEAPAQTPLQRWQQARVALGLDDAPPAIPLQASPTQPAAPPVPVRETKPAAPSVTAMLNQLGEGWHAIHHVAIGDLGNTIDHVVVGPAGVFTITAKEHPDVRVEGSTVTVAGQRQPYVRACQHEGLRATKLLSAVVGRPVMVTPILAITGRLSLGIQPVDVMVLETRSLVRHLSRLSPQLTDLQVQAVLVAAQRTSTWRVPRPQR